MFRPRTIRLDFNHQHLDYFTEIDAVLLTGIKFNPQNRPFDTPSRRHNVDAGGHQRGGRIQRRLDKLRFQPTRSADAAPLSDMLARLDEFLVRGDHAKGAPNRGGASLQTLPVGVSKCCLLIPIV